jgi:hypothetical protein
MRPHTRLFALLCLSLLQARVLFAQQDSIPHGMIAAYNLSTRPLLKFNTYPSFNRAKKKAHFDEPVTSDKTYLDFVGTGDIQKALSGGQDLNANTGAGIIFERYRGLKTWFQSLEAEMSINIATTSDSIMANVESVNGANMVTNQRDFGSYMINPQSGKEAIYANANLYFGYPENAFGEIARYISGVNVRFVGSNNLWQYVDPTTAANNFNVNVGAYELRLGISHEFLPDNVRIDQTTSRAKYSLFLGFNYSLRALVGDITSQENANDRMLLIGTKQTSFNGYEFDAGFRLNNLRLEFQVPVLSAGKSTQVPGLTNTQFLFTIRFIGGFGLELNTSTSGVTPDKK